MTDVIKVDGLLKYIADNKYTIEVIPPPEPEPEPEPEPQPSPDGPLGSVTNPFLLSGQVVSFSPSPGKKLYYSCNQKGLRGVQFLLKTYNAPTEVARITQVILNLTSGVYSSETVARQGGGLVYRACSDNLQYIFGIHSEAEWYQPWDVQLQMMPR